MNINICHFEEIIKKGYSLDIIYLLRLIHAGVDVESELCNNSVKIKAIYDSMMRKGLISSETKKLTLDGENLLGFTESDDLHIVKTKPLPDKDMFLMWWESYPSTNKFVINNMEFKATRSFKVKKEDCRILFNKMINDKLFTAEEIIEATKFDVDLKKVSSFKERKNNLTYLQNTHTYLYQKTFEGFVELIKEDKEILTTNTVPRGSTDI